MCSRSAPTQANVTNETTGWLCCNFVVYAVLDGADQLAGNDFLAVSYVIPTSSFLPNYQTFERHVDSL
jgi:hypothetical protein